MFCENCGAELKEGSKFCSHCGAPVKAVREESAPQPPVMETPKPYWESSDENERYDSGNAPAYGRADNFGGGTGGGYSPAGRLQSLVGGMAASSLFLVTTILFTAALVLQLASSIGSVSLGGNMLSSIIESVAGQAGFSLDSIGGMGTINAAMNALSAGTIITTIIFMIPGILVAIGLWMIFASAKSAQGASVKPAGFTIIKVIILIYFWIMIVVGAIAIIGLILGIVLTADYDAAIIAFIIVIALVAVVVALVCLYYSKTAKMLTSAREAGRGASGRLMVSTYVQVITWISAIVMVIGVVMSITSAGFLSSFLSSFMSSVANVNISTGFISPIPFLQNACTAVSMILFAVLIGKAKALEY